MGIYGLPVLLATVSFIALLFWSNQYGDAPKARSLAFQVVHAVAPQDGLAPEQALLRLKAEPASVSLHDTRLSESPFWLLVPLVAQHVDGQTSSIEFASRHATRLRCWNADTLQPLGSSDRVASDGALSQFKAGFALQLQAAGNPAALLCEARFVGPARITVLDWPTRAMSSTAMRGCWTAA
jgi:hypothetical protein